MQNIFTLYRQFLLEIVINISIFDSIFNKKANFLTLVSAKFTNKYSPIVYLNSVQMDFFGNYSSNSTGKLSNIFISINELIKFDI